MLGAQACLPDTYWWPMCLELNGKVLISGLIPATGTQSPFLSPPPPTTTQVFPPALTSSREGSFCLVARRLGHLNYPEAEPSSSLHV